MAAMRLVYQTQWICGAGAGGDRAPAVADESWMLHGCGCVQVTRERDGLLVRLDGRLFDQVSCDRLVELIERSAGRVTRYRFSVWSGIGAGAGWVTHTLGSAAAACRYARLLASVAGASDADTSIAVRTLRFERLLLERRGLFDEAVAAWLLDRRPDAAAVQGLFRPGREHADEGMKIVRRFGDNLVFHSYRAPAGHTWIPDQQARMSGSDLHAVTDRRLAHSLRLAADKVTEARGPVLEHVSGLFWLGDGAQFSEYHRLSLPLTFDDAGRADCILIATRW